MERRIFEPSSEAEKYTFAPEISTPEELNRLKNKAEGEWESFFKKPQEEITAASVTPALEAGETFFRKGLNKKRSEKDPKADVWYDRWEDYKGALDGAKGTGPVSKTAEFLREEAARYREEQEDGGQAEPITSKQGVVREFERIAGQTQDKTHREMVAQKLETAARLFEGTPKWEVTPES